MKNIEKQYLQDQREKIMDIGRELYQNWELSFWQLTDTYYNLYIKNNLY